MLYVWIIPTILCWYLGFMWFRKLDHDDVSNTIVLVTFILSAVPIINIIILSAILTVHIDATGFFDSNSLIKLIKKKW